MCRSCAVNIYDVFPDRLGDVTRDPVDDMITNREMGWDLRGYKGHYSDSLMHGSLLLCLLYFDVLA